MDIKALVTNRSMIHGLIAAGRNLDNPCPGNIYEY